MIFGLKSFLACDTSGQQDCACCPVTVIPSVRQPLNSSNTQPVKAHIKPVPECQLNAGHHLSGHEALWSFALPAAETKIIRVVLVWPA